VLNLGLRRGIGSQLFRVVLVVNVVAHANEFAAIITASEQNDSDAEDLRVGDTLVIGGVRLENELVHSDRNGTDKQRVEFLILLGAGEVSGRQLRLAGGVAYEVAEPTYVSFHSRSEVKILARAMKGDNLRGLPFWSCSRHSKVISNWYCEEKWAGLLRTLTPRSETTDMMSGCM
jgi:hypothetical protein